MAEPLSADIVERALAGDAAALRRMVDTYQDDMLNLAFRVTGDAEASWEIVRDVFMRLLEHPGSVAGREAIIEEPLLHGVWTLARQTDVRHDELPRGDRAVEAVAGAAMLLPDRSRCVLALGDLLKLGTPAIAAVLGITEGAAGDLLTRSRLQLAEGLGVRGRDQALVEAEAARAYGLWPAETGDPMAPEIIDEAGRRGLLGPAGAASGPVIAGVRITPAIGLGILLVPLLIAAAIAMAVRSGGDGDSDPVTPVGTDLVTEAFTDSVTGTDGASTRTTTNVVSTVSPGDSVTDSDGSSGAGGGSSGSGDSGGSGTPAAEPEPAPQPEPAPTTASEPASTPAVTRAPGSGAPPPPTTTQAAPAPATTTSGGAQPPPPGQVPLP
ncbi:MAG: RNA polymerase sigma factor [Thermoleophilia bacterium]